MLEKAFWLVIGASVVLAYLLGRRMLLARATALFNHDKRSKMILLTSGVVVGLIAIYPALLGASVVGYPIGMILGDRIGRALGDADIGAQVGFLVGLGVSLTTIVLFGVIAGGWLGTLINNWRATHERPNQAL